MADGEAKKGPVAAIPLPMLIGIVLGVALLVGGGTVAAFMFLMPKPAVAAEEGAADPTLADADLPAEGKAFVSIEEPFIINLAPSEEFPYTYLKFVISIEVADDKAAEDLNIRIPKVKALINGAMNNISYDSISTDAGQRKYANKITDELNRSLTAPPDPKTGKESPPPVFATYFTTLVAQ